MLLGYERVQFALLSVLVTILIDGQDNPLALRGANLVSINDSHCVAYTPVGRRLSSVDWQFSFG